jgi:hypothetical protein
MEMIFLSHPLAKENLSALSGKKGMEPDARKAPPCRLSAL